MDGVFEKCNHKERKSSNKSKNKSVEKKKVRKQLFGCNVKHVTKATSAGDEATPHEPEDVNTRHKKKHKKRNESTDSISEHTPCNSMELERETTCEANDKCVGTDVMVITHGRKAIALLDSCNALLPMPVADSLTVTHDSSLTKMADQLDAKRCRPSEHACTQSTQRSPLESLPDSTGAEKKKKHSPKSERKRKKRIALKKSLDTVENKENPSQITQNRKGRHSPSSPPKIYKRCRSQTLLSNLHMEMKNSKEYTTCTPQSSDKKDKKKMLPGKQTEDREEKKLPFSTSTMGNKRKNKSDSTFPVDRKKRKSLVSPLNKIEKHPKITGSPGKNQLQSSTSHQTVHHNEKQEVIAYRYGEGGQSLAPDMEEKAAMSEIPSDTVLTGRIQDSSPLKSTKTSRKSWKTKACHNLLNTTLDKKIDSGLKYACTKIRRKRRATDCLMDCQNLSLLDTPLSDGSLLKSPKISGKRQKTISNCLSYYQTCSEDREGTEQSSLAESSSTSDSQDLTQSQMPLILELTPTESKDKKREHKERKRNRMRKCDVNKIQSGCLGNPPNKCAHHDDVITCDTIGSSHHGVRHFADIGFAHPGSHLCGNWVNPCLIGDSTLAGPGRCIQVPHVPCKHSGRGVSGIMGPSWLCTGRCYRQIERGEDRANVEDLHCIRTHYSSQSPVSTCIFVVSLYQISEITSTYNDLNISVHPNLLLLFFFFN